MDIVGVFREHVVVVYELLRIRSGSGDANEAKLADDFFDIFVFPQTGSTERLKQIGATEQLQLNVGFYDEKKTKHR